MFRGSQSTGKGLQVRKGLHRQEAGGGEGAGQAERGRMLLSTPFIIGRYGKATAEEAMATEERAGYTDRSQEKGAPMSWGTT